MGLLWKSCGFIIPAAHLLGSPPAWATNVAVVGLFRDKAIVRIDNGPPRTLSAGETVNGVRLMSANSAEARLVVDGRTRTLGIGQSFAAPPQTDTRARVNLFADGQGHFTAAGSINGYPLSFLIDTGATWVAIGAADARRLGIDYRAGSSQLVHTAAGVVPAWRVTFNTVKVGALNAHQVEGLVIEAGLATPLLGMSFLNRTEMQRDGQTMVLTQRY